MRLLLCVALASCAAAAAAAPAPAKPAPPAYEELPPGRYSMSVTGMVSTVCSRAVAAEWGRLPEMEKVEVDFDAERAVILVRLDRTLKVSTLRRALRRAEKLARLGARYDLKDIEYVP
ncbi:MAG: heavy metal-associated domain-containing protein [Elusimicrobiota bacterium]|nr:heavy metal-associated domain-containing protein [Elusimicrobiota bacterium]